MSTLYENRHEEDPMASSLLSEVGKVVHES